MNEKYHKKQALDSFDKLLRRTFIPVFAAISVLGLAPMMGCAQQPVTSQNHENVALGKRVVFSPDAKGNKAENAGLTDGKIVKDSEQPLWENPDLAKWTYPGQFSLAIDLGAPHDISEIAVRLLNGAPQFTQNAGRMFPNWVEAFVSNDGENYIKVAEFSVWNKGEFARFDIGQDRDTSWMDTLRFKDLKTQGRWVGLRIYGTSRTASDEVSVYGVPAAKIVDKSTFAQGSNFTVTRPQVYFNKPYLEVANNLALPVPIGLSLPQEMATELKFTIDLPPGLEIKGGNIPGFVTAKEIKPQKLANGWTRYDLSTPADKARTRKDFARFYLQASGWKEGQKGELRYRFGDGEWQSPNLTIPVHSVHVPETPRPKKLMTSLGWWNDINPYWPNQLETLDAAGINTLNVMTAYGITNRIKTSVSQARKKGLFVSAIESPFHSTFRKAIAADEKAGKDVSEVYDQFADGKTGRKLCISYRGKYYQQEVDRVAQGVAQVKPDFLSMDNEQWGGDGPVDSENCLRCQADFKKSGLSSWDVWQQSKGKEIIADLATAVRQEVKKSGATPPLIGSYNVSPEWVYQKAYDFYSLYPDVLDVSEGSTYSPLQAADLVFIGDKARNARSKMPKSDVVPWLTPGDAGTFPGENFQWSLLEAYTNGARGVWFWSSRVWDAEDIIAYSKVIRALTPVEDIIVDGELMGDAITVEGKGRISGMKRGDRMIVLAADYFNESGGELRLKVNLKKRSQLRDLFTGEPIGRSLAAGTQEFTLPLKGHDARLLEVVPEE